jgi:hypothetical protein
MLSAAAAYELPAQEARPAPVVIRFDQYYFDASTAAHLARTGSHALPPAGLLMVGIANWAARAANKQLTRDYLGMVAEMPNIDLAAELTRTFGALGLVGGPAREVRILKPAEVTTQAAVVDPADLPPPAAGPLGMIGVTLNVIFDNNRFYVAAWVDFVSTDTAAAQTEFMMILHELPVEVSDEPWFKDQSAVTDSERKRLGPAREYWLTGSPNRLEREALAGIREIAQITAEVLQTAENGAIPRPEAWREDLPTGEALAQQTGQRCSGKSCRDQFARGTGDRQWAVRTWQKAVAVYTSPRSAPN